MIKSFAMTGHITTPLFKTIKKQDPEKDKNPAKFKFDVDKYIYTNIEKQWWA